MFPPSIGIATDTLPTPSLQARKEKRIAAYNNAAKYVKEYRALAAQRVRMHRQAKAAGNHYVDAEAKLMRLINSLLCKVIGRFSPDF